MKEPAYAAKSMLVIDDEDSICLAFSRFFRKRGWSVSTTGSAEEGLAVFDQTRPDVVFLDVRLPDRSGLEVLNEIAGRDAKIIVITAYGGLDTVVRALQGKAFDYLAKPLDLDRALSLAERAVEANCTRAATDGGALAGDLLVGSSVAIQGAYKLIARAAGTNSPVLVAGETGTGKELAATAIHRFSPRAQRPFTAINCGAIPESLIESELFGYVRGAFTGADTNREGKFATADGGTLLLDEIGELPPAVQVKLLRVLDTGTIQPVGSSQTLRLDVRIIAATNRDLSEEVLAGRFRQDLYYRLAVLTITMPPLRDRREDIGLLARHFAGELTDVPKEGSERLTQEAMAVLQRHDWPGNVRELKNAIAHALAVAPGRMIAPGDLPESVRRGGGETSEGEGVLERAAVACAAGVADREDGRYQQTLRRVEQALIAEAMTRFAGNQSEAAAWLGLHRNTLRNKLRELGLRED